MSLDPNFIIWQKQLLDKLSIGGTWTIPDGGMTFRKVAKDMVFIEERGTNRRMTRQVIAYILAAGYRIANAGNTSEGNGHAV